MDYYREVVVPEHREKIKRKLSELRYYAGQYDSAPYDGLFFPPSDARYYWIDGVLGGAHEYGDNHIIDSALGSEATIFATDSDEDAENLCDLLNSVDRGDLQWPTMKWKG